MTRRTAPGWPRNELLMMQRNNSVQPSRATAVEKRSGHGNYTKEQLEKQKNSFPLIVNREAQATSPIIELIAASYRRGNRLSFPVHFINLLAVTLLDGLAA